MTSPSRYRRSFEWHLTAASRDSIPTSSTAFVALSEPEYAEMFEDYLEISRKRKNNKVWLAKLQLHLVDELLQSEAAAKHYRQKQSDLKRSFEAEKQGPESKVEREQLEKDLSIVESELFYHRAYANCIRSIGDGIAWRTLGYDRAVMRALAQSATKPRVLAEGFIHELQEWSRTYDLNQGVAILNAVTNCLAIGDITVIHDDDSVEIVEVKASKSKSRRITRQKRQMRGTVNFLNFGKGEIEGKEVEIHRFDILPEHGLTDLLSLLQEAEKNGWASRRISNFLYVECVDFRALSDLEEMKTAVERALEVQTADWNAKGDLVIPMGSNDIISYTPNCVPFSIFPFPSKICVDLLTHSKVYRSFFNYSALRREFENRGWKVEKHPEDLLVEDRGINDPILVVNKGKFHQEIPPAYIMRMQMETIRPKVFIQECEQSFQHGPVGASPYQLVVFDREDEIWD